MFDTVNTHTIIQLNTPGKFATHKRIYGRCRMTLHINIAIGFYAFNLSYNYLRFTLQLSDLIKMDPQRYLWVKSSSFDRRTPCGQAVDFTPPSLAA